MSLSRWCVIVVSPVVVAVGSSGHEQSDGEASAPLRENYLPWGRRLPILAEQPRRAAARAASVRDSTPSLASTAEKWWWTVRSERQRRSAISALRSPSLTSNDGTLGRAARA